MAYDKADWHESDALERGQPIEHAAVHIGFFLEWLIRRGMTDPEMIEPDVVGAVERGERTGTDVLLDQDGVLADDMLSAEGRAFADAYYARYLDDFASVFADAPAYGVPHTAANAERMARVIDQRHAEWVYAGSPELPPEADPAEALAHELDAADLPPELTEEAVRGMSPGQLVDTLQRIIGRARRRN